MNKLQNLKDMCSVDIDTIAVTYLILFIINTHLIMLFIYYALTTILALENHFFERFRISKDVFKNVSSILHA